MNEISLKLKYRTSKSKGHNCADYNGNTGISRHKHITHADIHGIRRKRYARKYGRKGITG